MSRLRHTHHVVARPELAFFDSAVALNHPPLGVVLEPANTTGRATQSVVSRSQTTLTQSVAGRMNLSTCTRTRRNG